MRTRKLMTKVLKRKMLLLRPRERISQQTKRVTSLRPNKAKQKTPNRLRRLTGRSKKLQMAKKMVLSRKVRMPSLKAKRKIRLERRKKLAKTKRTPSKLKRAILPKNLHQK